MGKLKLPRLNISCIFGYKFLLDFGSNTEKSNFTQSVKAVTFPLFLNAFDNVVGTLSKGVSEPRIKVVIVSTLNGESGIIKYTSKLH